MEDKFNKKINNINGMTWLSPSKSKHSGLTKHVYGQGRLKISFTKVPISDKHILTKRSTLI